MLGVDYFSLEILTKMAIDLQWEIMGNLLDFDFDQTDLQDEKLDSPRSKNMFEVKVSASQHAIFSFWGCILQVMCTPKPSIPPSLGG